MLNRKNKKGFTLAELLIVVAIIAILVAIAVPLFVNGLTEAKKARNQATIRSVKEAALVYILTQPETDTNIYKSQAKELWDYYTVYANVDAHGNIKMTSVKYKETAPAKTDIDKVEEQSDGSFKVTAYLTATDFGKINKP